MYTLPYSPYELDYVYQAALMGKLISLGKSAI